jgi:hypothetical protein
MRVVVFLPVDLGVHFPEEPCAQRREILELLLLFGGLEEEEGAMYRRKFFIAEFLVVA